MTTSTIDQLVSDYLGRLNQAAYVLPADRRADLLDEISEHIASARAAGAAADEAAVRTLLDRLGEPEEIVAAARDDESTRGAEPWHAPPQPVPVAASPTLETWAVVMLTIGSVIPVVGWLVGVLLLWMSRRWRWPEKLAGTLIVPLGPGLLWFLAVLLPARSESCSVSGHRDSGGAFVQGPMVCASSGPPVWLGATIAIVVVLAPIAIGAVLLRLAHRRARTEPPVMRTPVVVGTAAGSAWGATEVAAVVCLGVGGFVVPLVGPFVGLVLAWSSPRWTDREKNIATALAVVPIFLATLVFVGFLV